MLDLKASLEDLRAGLDRKWRNQLKKAEASSPVFEFGFYARSSSGSYACTRRRADARDSGTASTSRRSSAPRETSDRR